MRAYILTAKETAILKRFLETGEKLAGFPVLRTRIIKATPRIRKDLDLIDIFLERIKATVKEDLLQKVKDLEEELTQTKEDLSTIEGH